MSTKTPTPRVLIAIPSYNCAKQLPRVLDEIDQRLIDRVEEIAVIDNGSTQNTVEVALAYKKKRPMDGKLKIFQNTDNYNLGGTHKVAFLRAEKLGFSHVLILHGDNQAKSDEANDLLDYCIEHPQYQTVLGSRFMTGSRLIGYDKKRIIGNKVLNTIYSVVTMRHLTDLGSGLNLFALADLDRETYLNFADKLTFNYELILDLVRRKVTFAYLPITWREEDQVSNARNANIFKTALVNLWKWRLATSPSPQTKKAAHDYTCKELR
jgi:glycosyltransferase involved in cell wall biosynthesis